MPDITNAQRALWTFLFFTLVGPFIAALSVVLLTLLATLAGVIPELKGLARPEFVSRMGQLGAYAYIWSALPAAMAAFGLLPFAVRKGTFSWIAAVVAGVLAFALAAVLFPLPRPDLMTYLAFIAGLVSLFCWRILRHIGVLN